MYERAWRCGAEAGADAAAGGVRRGLLAAALCCLRLTATEHAYLALPGQPDQVSVTGYNCSII